MVSLCSYLTIMFNHFFSVHSGGLGERPEEGRAGGGGEGCVLILGKEKKKWQKEEKLPTEARKTKSLPPP